MRLTLNAAETGHLVLATVHSGSTAEALQRVVAAFPAEIQNRVAAQVADCLIAVVAQRLVYRADLSLRVPECEILTPSFAVKNYIRNREFHNIANALETGADKGMWTFARYRTWLQARANWHIPGKLPDAGDAEPDDTTNFAPPPSPTLVSRKDAEAPAPLAARPAPPAPGQPGRIEIQPVEGGLDALLKKLG
jgi:twitching motility protein PilT